MTSAGGNLIVDIEIEGGHMSKLEGPVLSGSRCDVSSGSTVVKREKSSKPSLQRRFGGGGVGGLCKRIIERAKRTETGVPGTEESFNVSTV